MTGMLRRSLHPLEFVEQIVGPSLPATMGEVFSAATGMETTGSVVERHTRIRQAETGEFQGVPSEAGTFGGQERLLAEPTQPRVPAEKLNAEFGHLGLEFDKPMTRRSVELMAQAKRAEIVRNDIIQRGPGGVGGVAATLAGGLIATAIDPLEVASAFVPVVSQARMAGLAARFGRVGGRALAGALEGGVGNLMMEPLFGVLSRQQQLDYTMADALLNVGLGTVLGGVIGTARGVVAPRAAEPPFEATPSTTTRQVEVPPVVRAMDLEKRVEAFRASVAQLAEGRTVDVSDYLGSRRPETLTEFIARKGGINDADPTFRGEIESRGNPMIRVRGKFVGKLARRDAKGNLDAWAEAAQQEGFIVNRDVGELLDAIDSDLRGDLVVRRQEAGEIADIAEARQAQQDAERFLEGFDEARAELREAGVRDATPEEIGRVAEIMRRDRVDADTAFERMAIEREGELAQTRASAEGKPERLHTADTESSRAVDESVARGDSDLAEELTELQDMATQMREGGMLPDDAMRAMDELTALDEKAAAFGRTARAAAACLAR